MNEQKTSFQEWLLSERTIKLVLYSGAFLLVLAGLIYAREQIFALSGWAQLGLMLGATMSVYAGGVALIRQSASLRVGGLALIGVAAGFAPANFTFLYLFDLIDNMDERIVWLVASMICGLFYGLTMRLARTSMMTWFTALAVLSAYAAVISLLPISLPLCLILMGIPPFLLGYLAKQWRKIDWISKPLHTIAHIATPLLWLVSSGAWLHGRLDSPFSWIYQPDTMNPWLMLLSSVMAIAFYLSNDWQNSTKWEQWLSVSMVTGSLVLTTFQLPLTLTLCMGALILLGVGYLLIAWKIEPSAGHILPLYLYGYTLIIAVHLLSVIPIVWNGLALDLALLVTADVFIFLVIALVHRQKLFVSVAAVLFPLAIASYEPFMPDKLILGILKVNTLSAAWGVCSIIYQLLGMRLRKQDDDKTLSIVLIAIGSLLMLGAVAVNGITENIIPILGLITLGYILIDRVYSHDIWKFNAVIIGFGTLFAFFEFEIISYSVSKSGYPIEESTVKYLNSLCIYFGVIIALFGSATLYRYITRGKWKHWAAGFIIASMVILFNIRAWDYLWSQVWSSGLLLLADLVIITLILAVGTVISRKRLPTHLTFGMLTLITYNVTTYLYGFDLDLSYALKDLLSTLLFGMLTAVFIIGYIRTKRIASPLRLPFLIHGGIAAYFALGNIVVAFLLGIAAVLTALVWKRKKYPVQSNTLLVVTSIACMLIGLPELLAEFWYWNLDIIQIAWGYLVVGLLYIVLGRTLPGHFGKQVATPYQIGGAFTAILSLIVILADIFEDIDLPDIAPTTYGVLAIILGVTLCLNGLRKRVRWAEAWGYTGIVLMLTGIYTILADHNLITHEQLVILPIGLVMLGMGWHERKQGRIDTYRIFTLLALAIMFGSSFPSALNDDGSHWWLGLLLIIECVLAFAWGILNKSRNFVRLSITTVIAYGGLQFYSVATTLGRFAQIGGIGLLLLVCGLGLLMYRERLLQGHAELQTTWKNEWRP